LTTTNPSARTLLRDDYRDATNLDGRTRLYDCYSVDPRGWYVWVFEQLRLGPQIGAQQEHILQPKCDLCKIVVAA
jgi:hypothetical protein